MHQTTFKYCVLTVPLEIIYEIKGKNKEYTFNWQKMP